MIIRLTDDIYRGRRPTRELLLAIEPNPRTLLNLESGWYERLNPGVLKADELASELGMVQLRLPMSPLKPPSLAQVVEAYEMMNSLDVPRPLLVHCREGVDRTGVVSPITASWPRGGRPPMQSKKCFRSAFTVGATSTGCRRSVACSSTPRTATVVEQSMIAEKPGGRGPSNERR